MKRIFVFLLILSFTFSCSSAKNSLPEPTESVPLTFTPPALSKWNLSNGIEVVFAKSEDVPILEGGVYFSRGSLYDITPGTCESLGTILRQGGTAQYAPKELDIVLEKLTAQVSSSCSDEYFTLNFASLPADFNKVVEIASEVLFSPRFDRERFNLMINQSLELIKRRKDSPDTISQLTLNHALFHGTSFEEALDSKQLKKINLNEIKKTHQRLLKSGKVIIAIAGNIDEQIVKEILEKYFSKIPSIENKNLSLNLKRKATPGIFFVEDKKLTQTSILIGQRSIPRGDPDRFKVEVFNNIFGLGGFSSRLMQSLRADAGLTYSVYGGAIPGLSVGQNIIGLETKVQSTKEALEKVFQVIEGLKKSPPETPELDRAKNSLINSFIFRFETPGQRVARYAIQRMLNAPLSFDETYSREVPTITGAQVSEVAQKWWNDEQYSVVIVGPRESLDQARQVSKLQRYPVFEGTFNEVFSPL